MTMTMTFKQVPTDPRTPAPLRRQPGTSPTILAQIMEASDHQNYTPIGPQHVGQMGLVHLPGQEDNIRAALCHKHGHVLATLGVDKYGAVRAEEIPVVGVTGVSVGGVQTWVRAWMNVWVSRDLEDQALAVAAPGREWTDPHGVLLPTVSVSDARDEMYAVPIIRLGGEFVCADGSPLRWRNLSRELLETLYVVNKYGW